MIWALVPLKPTEGSKSRLAGTLSPQQRRGLALAMLEDVLTTLLAAPSVDCVLLLSRDEAGTALARALGADVLHEAAMSLNGALEEGARHAATSGATGLLVVPADLPLLTVADVQILTATPAGLVGSLTIARSLDGGTSALYMRPPLALPFCFGEQSFERHRAAAHSQGLDVHIHSTRNASLDDLDTPADLARLRGLLRGATARLLHSVAFD